MNLSDDEARERAAHVFLAALDPDIPQAAEHADDLGIGVVRFLTGFERAPPSADRGIASSRSA